MKKILILLIAVVMAAGSCNKRSEQESHPEPAATPPAFEVGAHLPAFETTDLYGHKLSSADLKDKVALIDFWATWCAPCLKEMPGYQALLDRYGSRGLVVIGFKADVMADAEDPLGFAKRLGIRYPIAIGTEGIRNKFGGLQGLPTTYIFDRHGVLRFKVVGFEYTSTIEKVITPLL